MTHLGDDAELYALGALDDAERVHVDAHAATCGDCLRRLGEAEAVVAAMIAADLPEAVLAAPARTRVSRLPHALQWLAVAAAICIFALPAAYFARENARMHASMHANEMLAARIASDDLQSAGFTSMHGGPMRARVLYDRAGDWYCVIVDRSQAPMQIAYVREDGSMEIIGSVAMRPGAPSMAIMSIPHKMQKLALLDGGVVVAEAKLAF